MKTTEYFINSVFVRRPYLQEKWLESVLENPIKTEVQPNGRIRYRGFIVEQGKYLQVVVESDGETIHNAFFDRRLKL